MVCIFFQKEFSLSQYSTTYYNSLRSQKIIDGIPSFKNSGFEAISKSIESPRIVNSSSIAFFTNLAVPTGTVLLVISNTYLFMCRPTVLATSNTYCKSALPSSSGGVPTRKKLLQHHLKSKPMTW